MFVVKKQYKKTANEPLIPKSNKKNEGKKEVIKQIELDTTNTLIKLMSIFKDLNIK